MFVCNYHHHHTFYIIFLHFVYFPSLLMRIWSEKSEESRRAEGMLSKGRRIEKFGLVSSLNFLKKMIWFCIKSSFSDQFNSVFNKNFCFKSAFSNKFCLENAFSKTISQYILSILCHDQFNPVKKFKAHKPYIIHNPNHSLSKKNLLLQIFFWIDVRLIHVYMKFSQTIDYLWSIIM